jgi:hypothetical protein
MGCVGIHLRNNWYHKYMLLKLVSSKKGWHSQWFYLMDYPDAPIPVYTGRKIFEAPAEWKADVPSGDEDKIANHLLAIEILKEHGLKGAGVIGAYRTRGVGSLMRRALSLFLMAPDTSREGMALAKEVLSNDEVI